MATHSVSPIVRQSLTLLGVLTALGAAVCLSIGGLLAAMQLGWLPVNWLEALLADNLNWYLIRGTGIVGYLLLTMSTVWGLLLSSKLIRDSVAPVLALGMHNYLSWNALLVCGLHAFLLLFNTWFDYTVLNLIVPFTGPYRPFWVGLGVIGFWLMLVVTLSFYIKRWIGQSTWRWLHYTSFLVFIFGALHGAFAGTDWALMGAVYIASSTLVAGLTLYRIGTALWQRTRKKPRRKAVAPAR